VRSVFLRFGAPGSRAGLWGLSYRTKIYFSDEEEIMATAKVFRSGNSPVVRLPEELQFSLEAEEVEAPRVGDRVGLEPVQSAEWPESFWRAFGGVTEDFARPPQVRQERENGNLILENDPRFLQCIQEARQSLREDGGVRLEGVEEYGGDSVYRGEEVPLGADR
jgi:virulence-associated protein VagC